MAARKCVGECSGEAASEVGPKVQNYLFLAAKPVQAAWDPTLELGGTPNLEPVG